MDCLNQVSWSQCCWKVLIDVVKSSSRYLKILDEICLSEAIHLTIPPLLAQHPHTHLYRTKKTTPKQPWIDLIYFCNIMEDQLETRSKKPRNYWSSSSCFHPTCLFLFKQWGIHSVWYSQEERASSIVFVYNIKGQTCWWHWERNVNVASEESSVPADSL